MPKNTEAGLDDDAWEDLNDPGNSEIPAEQAPKVIFLKAKGTRTNTIERHIWTNYYNTKAEENSAVEPNAQSANAQNPKPRPYLDLASERRQGSGETRRVLSWIWTTIPIAENNNGLEDALRADDPALVLFQRASWLKLRAMVTKELFDNLPAHIQVQYEDRGTAEHKEALEKWEKTLKEPPSKDPEDQQRCIQQLAAFIEPILDLVTAATGVQVSFIAGGPEPADAVRQQGSTTLSFRSTEREGYKSLLVPLYARYLKKVYNFAFIISSQRALNTQGPSTDDLWGAEQASHYNIDRIESGKPRLNTSGLLTMPPTQSLSPVVGDLGPVQASVIQPCNHSSSHSAPAPGISDTSTPVLLYLLWFPLSRLHRCLLSRLLQHLLLF
ncbi:hypothetical protein BJ138DRAFT_1121020 [Hygrophoropsis aurantiaca]|uniref:Uncharacterized protein n=1 Tax=Hygrophoropsis aurantiaca TaxID=72124 RepID=A0ACB7ZP27_9AGAM|nr:hypothetical protein BJ138DRAFT_1121020 [Hygrophoropsis aurantiaca]